MRERLVYDALTANTLKAHALRVQRPTSLDVSLAYAVRMPERITVRWLKDVIVERDLNGK